MNRPALSIRARDAGLQIAILPPAAPCAFAGGFVALLASPLLFFFLILLPIPFIDDWLLECAASFAAAGVDPFVPLMVGWGVVVGSGLLMGATLLRAWLAQRIRLTSTQVVVKPGSQLLLRLLTMRRVRVQGPGELFTGVTETGITGNRGIYFPSDALFLDPQELPPLVRGDADPGLTTIDTSEGRVPIGPALSCAESQELMRVWNGWRQNHGAPVSNPALDEPSSVKANRDWAVAELPEPRCRGRLLWETTVPPRTVRIGFTVFSILLVAAVLSILVLSAQWVAVLRAGDAQAPAPSIPMLFVLVTLTGWGLWKVLRRLHKALLEPSAERFEWDENAVRWTPGLGIERLSSASALVLGDESQAAAMLTSIRRPMWEILRGGDDPVVLPRSANLPVRRVNGAGGSVLVVRVAGRDEVIGRRATDDELKLMMLVLGGESE